MSENKRCVTLCIEGMQWGTKEAQETKRALQKVAEFITTALDAEALEGVSSMRLEFPFHSEDTVERRAEKATLTFQDPL